MLRSEWGDQVDDCQDLEQPHRSRRLRAAVLAVAGLLLVWQIVTHSFVAFLAERAPRAALVLNPSNPAALVNVVGRAIHDEETLGKPARWRLAVPDLLSLGTRLSDKGLGDRDRGADDRAGKVDGGDTATTAAKGETVDLPTDDKLRQWAVGALAAEPLNARALTLLGLLADRAGNDEAAGDLMASAARHSLHESAALNWLLRRAYKRNDAKSLVAHADVLLRSRPELSKFVVAKLVEVLENKTGDGDLAKGVGAGLRKLLATDPPWRKRFFYLLPETITDGKTPLDLLLSVKADGLPPEVDELQRYLNLLVRNELYELAYFAWLQFLPAAQLATMGGIYNGSFESNPSGLPFDWTVLPGSGVTIDLVERADYNGRALVLQFTQGRVDFRGLTEHVLLSPGRYHFNSKYKGSLAGRRGLVWRVRCAGEDTALGEIEIATGVQPDWFNYGFDFTVPEAGCRAQVVQLSLNARSMSERLITGEAWFDDVSIEPVKEAKPTSSSQAAPTRTSN